MNVYIPIASSLLSSILLISIQKYFFKKQLYDPILKRSSHKTKATRSGGIAIFLSSLIISIYFYLNQIEIFDYSLLIPLSILLIVGLYDDIYDVDFKLKFLFQIITAKILIDYGLIIDNFHGILGVFELNRIFAQVFTIFIIVAIINAINFIDGIDTLACLIISIFIFSFEFFSNGQSRFFYFSIIILSSIIPLIYFNLRKKNKIFLGDSGSLFLGGLVAIYVLEILSPNYIIKPQYDLNKIIFVISVLIYPIIDIVRVFFLRILNRRSPFIADRNHIHHIILLKMNSHIKTSLIISLISLLFLLLTHLIF